MYKIILLTVALIVAGAPTWGADGSISQDPLWRFSDTSAKQNLIFRDSDGRRVGYLINDPIFPGDQWILYKKDQGKVGTVVRDPILDGHWILFDMDPVGE